MDMGEKLWSKHGVMDVRNGDSTEGEAMAEQPNPFYSNYVFSKSDLSRCRLRWSDRLRVFFRPMHVQFTDGYAVHYKISSDGAIYLYRFEKL